MPSMISMLEVFMPPGPKDLADFPKLVRHEFTVKDKTDIVFSIRLDSCPRKKLTNQPSLLPGDQKVLASSYEKRLFKLNKVVKSIKASFQ